MDLKKYCLFLFIVLTVCSLSANMQEILKKMYVSFEESMLTGFSEHQYTQMLIKKKQREHIPFLKQLYEQNNFLTKLNQPPLTQKIPKIIHQIWLGSPMPERYKKFQASWKKHHPDWEYRLWTNADVTSFKLINQKAFDEAKNYAEKANVFRYEILDRFGGLYIDTDFECLKPFDLLHEYYEFYTGIASINRVTLINNGLIGSIPGHPIVKACIANINKHTYGFGQMGKNGAIYFGNMVVQTCQQSPVFDLSKVIILPPTYVYPWPGLGSTKTFDEYILDSSFAVHYWDGTWTRSSKFKIPHGSRPTF